MLPQKLAFVDIETTGMNVSRDRIIEIGILRVENNRLVKTYQTLLDPQISLPHEIEILTGINGSDLEKAPTFWQIKDDIQNLLDDCVIVAHNARFDHGFIKYEYKRIGDKLSSKSLCTVKLFRSLFPGLQRYGLDSLISYFNFEIKSRHRAFDDAKVLWDFYQQSILIHGEQKVDEAVKKILKRPKLPVKLNQKVIDDLPESPGVYIFYGESGMPIYVGKSIDIKERVLSHFSSDEQKEIIMSQQIESVEYIKTAGELGALLKELEMIGKLQPLYNRLSRNSRKSTVLFKNLRESNYWDVSIKEMESIDGNILEDIVGVFKNRKQAKEFLTNISDEFGLCRKLLGIEHSSSSCFGYRLGKCRGACVGKESVEKYNARFSLAFSQKKFKPWPFLGAVVVSEEDDGVVDRFVIDNWQYLGLYEESPVSKGFDTNVYRVLEKFLLDPRNMRKIKSVKGSLSRE